jgi:methionyl-tRNA formyltransferase
MTEVPRIAAFVSHYAGHAVLRELLGMRAVLRVVLVATDDPESSCCNASARIWRYGWDDRLGQLVTRLAAEGGLEAFTGPVRREGGLFHDRFVAARPDAIIAMVFGQRIPEHLLDLVGRRAWNVHPVVPGRPLAATGGPGPYESAYRLGARSVQLCVHRMTGAFDDGEEVARSVPFPLPPATRPGAEPMLELQRRTAPVAAALVRSVLPGLFGHRPKARPLPSASLEERNSP